MPKKNKIKRYPKRTPQHVWQLSAPSQRKKILQRAGVDGRAIAKMPLRKNYANLSANQLLLWNNTLIHLRDKLGIFLIS